MRWTELERATPKLAEHGRDLFRGAGVGLLGTLGPDGWPNLSPVGPYFAQGHLLFGAMSWSAKARHLLRDARCTLHSAITAPDRGEAEFKLLGRAVPADA